jgi:hypothetical protein
MVAWLATVAVGMALRVAFGQGTAVAFIIVALGFLGLFLLGWRLLLRGAVLLAAGRLSRRKLPVRYITVIHPLCRFRQIIPVHANA